MAVTESRFQGLKTAVIPLFPDAKAALDAYQATRPALLPEAPLFTNDRIGGLWAYPLGDYEISTDPANFPNIGRVIGIDAQTILVAWRQKWKLNRDLPTNLNDLIAW
jgi:hypothetical protein